MAILALILATISLFLCYLRLKIENYIAVLFIVVTFSGIASRIVMYFFGDASGIFNAIPFISVIPIWVRFLIKLPYLLNKSFSPLIALCLISFTTYFFLGAVENFIASIYSFFTFSTFFIFLLMPYLYKIRQDKLYEALMPVFKVTLAVVIGYGLSQFVLGPNAIDVYWMAAVKFNSLGLPLPFAIKPFSVLSSPGSYSVFLLIAFVLVVNNYYIVRKKRSSLLGVYLVIALIMVAQITTGVRSSLLIMFCMTGYFLAKQLVERRIFFKAFLSTILILVVALQLLPLTQIEDLQQLQSRVTEIDRSDISYNKRIDQLRYALNEIAENPIGFGLGSSGRFSNNSLHIENGYTELIYQMGVFLGSIILLIIVSLFFTKNKMGNRIEYESYFILPIYGKLILLILLLIMLFTHILQQPIGWLGIFFYAISNLNLNKS